jgi:hypothetical protein
MISARSVRFVDARVDLCWGSGWARNPLDRDAPSVSPLNDTDLMAGLQAGKRIDTEPAEQGGGIKVR